MTPKPTSIIIIDDHQLFADGLELLLLQLPGEIEIAKYDDAQQVLECARDWAAIDLVIIDLHMPQLSGFAFLQALVDTPARPRVAVISGVESRSEIERALALGASGFIPKDSAGSEMLNGVSAILRGERYLPQHWLGKINWPQCDVPVSLESQAQNGLGPRQIQVLKLLQDGLQNKQIALVLGVSVSTVKSHTQLLYRALNVNNRTAAIRAASDLGLL